MRSFEQRKAEVFRRSEERIQKRIRMKRRLLTASVPLLLCVTLSAITLLPGLENGTPTGALPGGSDGLLTDTAASDIHDSSENIKLNGSVVQSSGIGTETCEDAGDTTVEVLQNGVCRFCDRGEAAERIRQTIREILNSPAVELPYGEMSDAEEAQTGYRIIFTNDEVWEYFWTGTVLTDCAANTHYILSDAQRAALEEITGLSVE